MGEPSPKRIKLEESDEEMLDVHSNIDSFNDSNDGSRGDGDSYEDGDSSDEYESDEQDQELHTSQVLTNANQSSPEMAQRSFEERAATGPRCMHCMEIIFQSRAEVGRHMSKWHCDDHLCKACDEGFLDREALNETRVDDLLRSLEGPVEKQKDKLRLCTCCDRYFPGKDGLTQHLKHRHALTYCFSCKIHFDDAQSRQRHIIKNARRNTSECQPWCSISQEKVEIFLLNGMMAHSDCAPCGLTFDNMQHATDHCVKVHYMCGECLHMSRDSEGYAKHRETRCPVGRGQATTAVPAPAVGVDAMPAAPLNEAQVSMEVEQEAPARKDTDISITATTAVKIEHPESTTSPAIAPPVPQSRAEPRPRPPPARGPVLSYCRYCDYRSREAKSCLMHTLAKHHDQYYSWCEICQVQFANLRDRWTHILDSPDHLFCKVCSDDDVTATSATDTKVFSAQHDLEAHMRAEHSYCEKCDMWIRDKNLDTLRHHREEVHFAFFCKACDENFLTEHDLRRHKDEFDLCEIMSFGCLGCQTYFGTMSQMMEHLESGQCKSRVDHEAIKKAVHEIYQRRTSDAPPPLDFKCPECKKEFHRMSLLFSHLEDRACPLRKWKEQTRVRQTLLDPLQAAIFEELGCSKCKTFFKTDDERDDHLQDKHDEKFCFMCETHFSKKGLLIHLQYGFQNSMHRIASLKDETFLCDDCEPAMTFANEMEYYQHLWLSHDSCAICLWDFESREQLIAHDEKEHNSSLLSPDPLPFQPRYDQTWKHPGSAHATTEASSSTKTISYEPKLGGCNYWDQYQSDTSEEDLDRKSWDIGTGSCAEFSSDGNDESSDNVSCDEDNGSESSEEDCSSDEGDEDNKAGSIAPMKDRSTSDVGQSLITDFFNGK
ncbi:hypothetical protein FLONG3_4299 [Fusarium longipes]|uniref:C2H2-type domain-containing protein n=1 Tax=Fusarium longipes TaxID=694270 RepID=A0A395SYU0_9HYPO|nr:hypothetical protein FLONG3_4299 [Fusarium longipes]